VSYVKRAARFPSEATALDTSRDDRLFLRKDAAVISPVSEDAIREAIGSGKGCS